MEPFDTTYKARAVWPFRLAWGNPEESWDTNLEQDRAGFGAATRWLGADEARRTFAIEVQCGSRAVTEALETFFAAHSGRQRAFWFPSLVNQFALAVDAVAGGATIDVFAVGLAAAWETRAGLNHVAFLTPEGMSFAEIASVESIDEDTDRLTLTAPLNRALTAASTVVSPLLVVRFGSDELTLAHVTDEAASAALSLVELPKEYLEEYAGLAPVFLYQIAWGSVVHRVTSHAEAVQVAGETWLPQDITHTGFRKSLDFFDEGGSLTWNCADEDFWLRQYRQRPVDPWKVSLYAVTLPAAALPAPDYVGYFESVNSDNESSFTVPLTSHEGLDQRQTPGLVYARKCSWIQYGAACGLQNLFWSESGTVTAANMAWGHAWLEIAGIAAAAQALVDAGKLTAVDDYLPGGELMADGQRFSIIGQEGERVYVLWPRARVSLGAVASWVPACQQDFGRCTSLFSNNLNFGGDPYAPILNPHGRAWQIEQGTTGGKK